MRKDFIVKPFEENEIERYEHEAGVNKLLVLFITSFLVVTLVAIKLNIQIQ